MSKRDLCEPGTKNSWLVSFIDLTKMQEQAKSLEVDLHLLLLPLSLFFLLAVVFDRVSLCSCGWPITSCVGWP